MYTTLFCYIICILIIFSRGKKIKKLIFCVLLFEGIAARGGKNAKKKVMVAVARKQVSLIYLLWESDVVYDPNYTILNAINICDFFRFF